jgi:hypothetical protein
MNKTHGKKAEPTGSPVDPSAARAAVADMTGGGNLDQVREILFGSQSRSLDKRLARLEEELPKRVAEIRDDLKRSLAGLETYARTEIDSLNERLRVEGKERGKQDNDLASRLDETGKAVRHEALQLDERSSAAQRELRAQLLDQAKRTSEEIQRRSDELTAALVRAVDELRTEKADRKAMAGILHEVAMRLTDDLSLPTGDGSKP